VALLDWHGMVCSLVETSTAWGLRELHAL
jgi:hypothetical protein